MVRVTGHVRRARRKRGDVFYLKYRLADGRQVQRALGPVWTERSRPPAGYFTQRTAQETLQALLADARRGTLADHDRPSGRTFGDACAEWLRYCELEEQRAESTIADYTNMVKGRLLSHFGRDTPLEKVTTAKIDAYREELLSGGDDEKKLSRRTVQKLLIALHGIFARAKQRQWIASNPASDAQKVRLRRSGDFNVLTPVEVTAVIRQAETDQDGAIFAVAAFTGLRLGELRALRWGDVDFTGRAILVRRNLPAGGSEKTPKSGKVRSVPLIDQAARPLDALSRREHFTGQDDRVFVSENGAPVDGDAVRDRFYAALAAADLGRLREKDDPIVFHDLRHTFGTLGANSWPLHDLQAYMGHASITTTQIYMHHVPKVAAADELSRAVEAAMGGDVSPEVSRTEENSAQLGETDITETRG